MADLSPEQRSILDRLIRDHRPGWTCRRVAQEFGDLTGRRICLTTVHKAQARPSGRGMGQPSRFEVEAERAKIDAELARMAPDQFRDRYWQCSNEGV
jgi:hypothetical protein